MKHPPLTLANLPAAHALDFNTIPPWRTFKGPACG
jgi:hypothetical protein